MNLRRRDRFISVHDHDEALSSRLATLRGCPFIWRRIGKRNATVA
jgi:hypothetical protein